MYAINSELQSKAEDDAVGEFDDETDVDLASEDDLCLWFCSSKAQVKVAMAHGVH
jgi:hypothetical protein